MAHFRSLPWAPAMSGLIMCFGARTPRTYFAMEPIKKKIIIIIMIINAPILFNDKNLYRIILLIMLLKIHNE